MIQSEAKWVNPEIWRVYTSQGHVVKGIALLHHTQQQDISYLDSPPHCFLNPTCQSDNKKPSISPICTSDSTGPEPCCYHSHWYHHHLFCTSSEKYTTPDCVEETHSCFQTLRRKWSTGTTLPSQFLNVVVQTSSGIWSGPGTLLYFMSNTFWSNCTCLDEVNNMISLL